MKLAFSTLACPGWTWQEALDQAVSLGYDGVEWRLVDGKMVDAEFPVSLAYEIGRASESAGVGITALDSSIQLTVEPSEERDRMLDDCRALLRLAAAFGAPYLRVFAGTYPTTVPDSVARQWTQDALLSLRPDARDSGVKLALELHDCGWDRAGLRGVTSSGFLADVLRGVEMPEAGLQWDLGNPLIEGEPAATTWENVRPFLTYLQVKDMVRTNDGWRYVPIGSGEVPISDVVSWVQADGFTGWMSFEWEKWWHPELAEPEIVLPWYVTYMERFRG
jgi:sugar phosphate isomerase/epimerase